jgi:hypothetical protein
MLGRASRNFRFDHLTVAQCVSYVKYIVAVLADNHTQYDGYTYSQVYSALQSVDGAAGASPTQRAAASALAAHFPTDPTNGSQFLLTPSEAAVLGLSTTTGGSDGKVTLNSDETFSWSDSAGVAAKTFDAVGAIEHEISETLGRTAFLGTLEPNAFDKFGDALPSYNILDLFHYTAAGNANAASYGAAAGALDEPFVAGYNAASQGYFSYNGSTVTLPFASPSEVTAGVDVGDWTNTVSGDSFGFASPGVVENVSATDLEELNILGYSEITPPCYCAGTMIATLDGEASVETLKVGDTVILARGGQRRIVWIGHRRLDTRRHAAPREVWPVRVCANAFGGGLPRRDLWLSPGHSVAVDGVLIPIRALINGCCIVQLATQTVDYWHIELSAHDVVLAEGLPAESYLDTGNRNAFANGGGFVEAHPDFKPRRWNETCLPLVGEGPQVARVKARLLGRLRDLGYGFDQDAGAHVLVDGLRIEPICLSPTRLGFLTPGGGRKVSIQSNVFVPAHAIAESTDTRELGLCVGALQIDGEAFALDDDARCESGWHAAEFEHGLFRRRWTKGATPLPPGVRLIVVDLAGAGAYWRDRAIRTSVKRA